MNRVFVSIMNQIHKAYNNMHEISQTTSNSKSSQHFVKNPTLKRLRDLTKVYNRYEFIFSLSIEFEMKPDEY